MTGLDAISAGSELSILSPFVTPNNASNQASLPYSNDISSMSSMSSYPLFLHTPEISPSITLGLCDSPFNEQSEPYIQYYFEHMCKTAKKSLGPGADEHTRHTVTSIWRKTAVLYLHTVISDAHLGEHRPVRARLNHATGVCRVFFTGIPEIVKATNLDTWTTEPNGVATNYSQRAPRADASDSLRL
ncbi:uncharacterized protein PHACADRAFT_200737 [Phanerochaete carnosa HHB-10118-sp]|uniref:Uncharacterized protein n=1 Tax=Phanerochaete carnosa (strain HHB-10118-sp) TaxID=650164 RepID=K5WKP8_PHACS|nr:uncharacterized protein PHACADRAFT_200737 [Phanerochaete carnosa HHB-10118-sp]EKM50807.1 hypothetical protein PHACADRAFT_200737 [Phanerochaete carnosa HHB-10118-sp]